MKNVSCFILKSSLFFLFLFGVASQGSGGSPKTKEVGKVAEAPPLFHLEVTPGPPEWRYKIVNDVPKGSSIHLCMFSLHFGEEAMVANFSVGRTPLGWGVDTDSHTYVSWGSIDDVEPFPHDVKSGGSLDGFILKSLSPNASAQYLIQGWDSKKQEMSPAVQGFCQGPLNDSLQKE